MFFLTNGKKDLKRNQIIFIGIIFIIIFATVIHIFVSTEKKEIIMPADHLSDYIVSEYFIEKNNDTTTYYETRYYSKRKKTFLIITKENGKEKEEIVSEIDSKYINAYVDFSIDNKPSTNVKDLTNYGDESGFIYNCELNTMEEFLSNEANQGNILLINATPYFFECYLKDKEGKTKRGLVLYNSDLKTGTFIYKECKKGSSIPSVTDLVETTKKNNK